MKSVTYAICSVVTSAALSSTTHSVLILVAVASSKLWNSLPLTTRINCLL